MRKCIKEKINKEITIRNAETLAAVERERERERERFSLFNM